MYRPLQAMVALIFLVPFSAGQMQMSTLSGAQAIADLPGPPKNPTVTAMAPLWQGMLQQLQIAHPSGPILEARQEDVVPDGAAPYPARRTTMLKFDGDGHEAERIYEDSSGTTTTLTDFQNGRLQSRKTKHLRTNGKFPALQEWEEWQKWTYDTKGRLKDFRAGQDKMEYNHYLNFKYDSSGRPLGYEYRPSGADGPSTFTEITYSGDTVTTAQLDDNRQKVSEQVQMLDPLKRVIDLSVSDMSSGKLRLWYHVRFKYDGQGRLIEQITDPYQSGSGGGAAPPPGKITVQYDDGKHTGEEDFYNPDEKLALRNLVEFDSHGCVTKALVLDATGKQTKASEGTWVDPRTHATHSGAYATEATYDDHGNWTEFRWWFIPSDGGDRVLTRWIKQTITYR
jgi:hypothetical protein